MSTGSTMNCQVCNTTWPGDLLKVCPLCSGVKMVIEDITLDRKRLLSERDTIQAKLDYTTALMDSIIRRHGLSL